MCVFFFFVVLCNLFLSERGRRAKRSNEGKLCGWLAGWPLFKKKKIRKITRRFTCHSVCKRPKKNCRRRCRWSEREAVISRTSRYIWVVLWAFRDCSSSSLYFEDFVLSPNFVGRNDAWQIGWLKFVSFSRHPNLEFETNANNWESV